MGDEAKEEFYQTVDILVERFSNFGDDDGKIVKRFIDGLFDPEDEDENVPYHLLTSIPAWSIYYNMADGLRGMSKEAIKQSQDEDIQEFYAALKNFVELQMEYPDPVQVEVNLTEIIDQHFKLMPRYPPADLKSWKVTKVYGLPSHTRAALKKRKY